MEPLTRNKDGTPRKKGSGRPKGSSSFIDISLRELVDMLGEGAVEEKVRVSRVWLEKQGYTRALEVCTRLNESV